MITECIDSIGNFLDVNPYEVELIIVDNSLAKNAEEMKNLAENHPLNQLLEIKYIYNSENLGYGQGNNIGIKVSTCDIICIMNPDIRFGEPILRDVFKKFKNTNLALLGYKQVGGFNYSFYMKPECRNSFTDFITKFINKIDIFFPKCFYLSGAFFFVDKHKFQEVGNFDEKIFLYFEEPDIANRLQAAGYQVQYDKSKIYHHLVGDRVAWSQKQFNRVMESLIYYLDKFKISKKKYFNVLKREVRIKLFIAGILNDKVRSEKFAEELKIIKRFNHDEESFGA